MVGATSTRAGASRSSGPRQVSSGFAAPAHAEPGRAGRHDDARGADPSPEIGAQERHPEEWRSAIRGAETAVEHAVHEVHGLGHQHLDRGLCEDRVGERRMPDVPLSPAPQGVVRHDPLCERVASGRQLAIRVIDQIGAEHQHQRGLPPAAVRVVAESPALFVGQRAAERRLDLRKVTAEEELPRDVAGDGRHRHAVASRDESRSLLERREMSRTAVAVRDEDEPKARPCERAAVVHERVANHALAHVHGAHRLERERAEVERGREHDGPVRPLGDQPVRHRAREMARRERIHPDGQMRAVLLERAHGQDHGRPRAVQRVQRRRGHLLETVDTQKLLPFVATR